MKLRVIFVALLFIFFLSCKEEAVNIKVTPESLVGLWIEEGETSGMIFDTTGHFLSRVPVLEYHKDNGSVEITTNSSSAKIKNKTNQQQILEYSYSSGSKRIEDNITMTKNTLSIGDRKYRRIISEK